MLPVFLLAGICLLVACRSDKKNDYLSWDTYRASKDAAQFSGLKQITTENVHLLEPAWEFHTGDNGPRTPMECNPIVIGDIMYVTSPKLDLIALDAKTGERQWHYQAVTHDVWDYDLPCAPTLVTIPFEGKSRKALIQPTKMGELILLDRYTGEPLMAMEERAVPPSYVPGERAHPTQKFNQGI